jgi:guanylate kinase
LNNIEEIIKLGNSVLKDVMKCKKSVKKKTIDLLIVSGPSGVGKGTIFKQLAQHIKIKRFPIYTTRKKRSGEIDGSEYFFITKEEYEKMKNNDRFLIYGKVHECLQGIGTELLDFIKNNDVIYIELHITLVEKLIPILEKNKINYLYIFILPPSYEELMKRLLERSKNECDSEILIQRLKNSINEIKHSIKFSPYYVINDKLDKTVEEMLEIIQRVKIE